MEVACQCGTTTFSTPTPEPLAIYLCHCTQCRKQSSSAFGISLIYPYFSIPEQCLAKVKDFMRTTYSGAKKHCWFCGICGSRLMHWTEGGKTVSVKGGCCPGLGREMMRGAKHIWTREAIVEIPEGVTMYEEEPPDDE